MTHPATSTMTALFYANPDTLELHALASKLAAAMLQHNDGAIRIHTDYDDVVLFDLPGMRIGLAQADLTGDFPGVVAHQGCSSCVIVAASALPGTSAGDAMAPAEVCTRLAQRLEAKYPAEGEVVVETDVVFSEHSYDDLLEEIVTAFDGAAVAELDPAPEGWSEAADPAFATETVPPAEDLLENVEVLKPARVIRQAQENARHARPDPLSPEPGAAELFARYDRELAQRSGEKPSAMLRPRHHSPGPTVFPAADTPRTSPHTKPTSARARAAFAPVHGATTHGAAAADAAGQRAMAQMAPGAERQSGQVYLPVLRRPQRGDLTHRAAINALNAAALVFALPVGAFLMTMAVLGRESLTTSARAMALSGAGIGVTHTDAALQTLHSLFS